MNSKETLGFSHAVNVAAAKIFQLKGRSRRSEYWWTMLCIYIIGAVATLLRLPLILFILNLAVIPLTFRRLHDTGRSGWWWGIYILLVISFLFLIIIDYTTLLLEIDKIYDIEFDYSYRKLLMKYLVFVFILLLYRI
ncbi:MAG: DUF805 domain-containing protein, partial [Lachnospiraceae bacterium]|nr:DUF805 domain-containing protein [Lachnospiraceae bacterium]